MQYYAHTDGPLSLHGTVNVRFERIEHAFAERISKQVSDMSVRAPGARIRFETDSDHIYVALYYAVPLAVDLCMPLCGASGADVYAGTGFDAEFIGLVTPSTYEQRYVEAVFEKPKGLMPITITLPRNTPLSAVRIGIDDGARMLPAHPYTVSKPMLFYGSSITEGGCSLRPSMAYTALLSRWLDAEYINLGYSGGAKGEPEMAQYIAKQPMSVLIMDYDHNAPSEEHLAATHEPFFRAIRQARPDLPILLLTRPDYDLHVAQCTARTQIIRQTYQNARNSGDSLVWFIDGKTFFDGPDRSFCTVDGVHPTDLGFFRMATKIYPTLCEILGQSNRYPKTE